MFAFNRLYFHDAYTSDRESCGGNVSRTKPANKFPITGSFDCIFIRWFRLTIPCIRSYAEAVFEYFDRSTMKPNKIKENDNCFLKRSLLSCNGSLKRILSFEKISNEIEIFPLSSMIHFCAFATKKKPLDIIEHLSNRQTKNILIDAGAWFMDAEIRLSVWWMFVFCLLTPFAQKAPNFHYVIDRVFYQS